MKVHSNGDQVGGRTSPLVGCYLNFGQANGRQTDDCSDGREEMLLLLSHSLRLAPAIASKIERMREPLIMIISERLSSSSILRCALFAE